MARLLLPFYTLAPLIDRSCTRTRHYPAAAARTTLRRARGPGCRPRQHQPQNPPSFLFFNTFARPAQPSWPARAHPSLSLLPLQRTRRGARFSLPPSSLFSFVFIIISAFGQLRPPAWLRGRWLLRPPPASPSRTGATGPSLPRWAHSCTPRAARSRRARPTCAPFANFTVGKALTLRLWPPPPV